MRIAQHSSMPLRRRLDVIVTRWHRLIESLRAPYRPELHYMRGPGPKWRALADRRPGKHARGELNSF